MPTPRPIIDARIGATSAMSVKAATMVTAEKPVASPNRASPMGMPPAITEPKAMRRMTTAAAMPMSSALPVSGRSAYRASSPPSSTWMPSARPSATTCSRDW